MEKREGENVEGYTVRQAVEVTGVKSHVLRYWEEELHLTIRRNEFGHRFYTEQDIHLFLNIQKLKEKGFQLKGIRDILPQISEYIGKDLTMALPCLDELQTEIESGVVEGTALEEKNDFQEKFIKFQSILERLIQAELHMRSPEETRYRFLDQTIRRLQAARKEIAAAKE